MAEHTPARWRRPQRTPLPSMRELGRTYPPNDIGVRVNIGYRRHDPDRGWRKPPVIYGAGILEIMEADIVAPDVYMNDRGEQITVAVGHVAMLFTDRPDEAIRTSKQLMHD